MVTTDFIEESNSSLFAEFKKPENLGDPIIVNRYLPDNSTERIGSICSEFTDEGAIFTCIDRNGKTLFTPTDDYSLAEGRFELYAKKLMTKAIEEQGKRGSTYAARIEELKTIRNNRHHEKEKRIEN